MYSDNILFGQERGMERGGSCNHIYLFPDRYNPVPFGYLQGGEKMTEKQEKFADYFIELGNKTEAAIKAGYSRRSAGQIGHDNLKKPEIIEYINSRIKDTSRDRIARGEEVLEYLTQVMRGEIPDQFGLEAPLSERTKAAVEIAKRTIDIQLKGGSSDEETGVVLIAPVKGDQDE